MSSRSPGNFLYEAFAVQMVAVLVEGMSTLRARVSVGYVR